jgi:serralysin
LGADTLNGGVGGCVTASYANAVGGVVVDLLLGLGLAGEAAGDTLIAIDNLIGSAFDDTLVGNNLRNRLEGGAGNDTLNAQGEADILVGGDGDDVLNGGTGRDTASYYDASAGVTVSLLLQNMFQDTIGAGFDRLVAMDDLEGSGFADVLTGNGLGNRLTGLAGDDRLTGGDGDDVLTGGDGDDRLDGGAGIDTASYEDAASGVTVTLAAGANVPQDTIGAGIDRLIGIERLLGSAFDDTLTGSAAVNRLGGGAGDDTLTAGAGADRLFGDAGDDILAGEAGDDQLTGGAGADVFVFTPGSGLDRILDFEDGIDRIAISGFGAAFDTPAEWIAAAVQVGVNLDIRLPDPGAATTTTIRIRDFSLAQLDADDFLIA